MSHGLATLDYEELSEGGEVAGKLKQLLCPADNCQAMSTYDKLCSHWACIHQAKSLLYLCLFQGWGCKKMLGMDLYNHMLWEHELISEGLAVFDAAPAIVGTTGTQVTTACWPQHQKF